MRHSDIFEAYAKLSEKEGIVKEAVEEEKSSSKSRYSKEQIETIEALYGVRPETIPGMEYENNLSEYAHPNAVVISDSYDKINGLVENITERQNIIINKILSKPPSGGLIQHKDASKGLGMQLIRIANDMDAADEEEIRLLADECFDALQKKAQWYNTLSDWAHKAVDAVGGNGADKFVNDMGGVGEGAIAGAAIGAVLMAWTGPGVAVGAGIGAVVGGTAAALFNTSPKVKSVKENAKDLLDQMNDLKKSVPGEAAFFQTTEEDMAKLVASSDKYLVAMDLARTKYVKGQEASSSELQEITAAGKDFKTNVSEFGRLRDEFNRKNQAGAFATGKSGIPHLGFASDDIEDVEQSFSSLQSAIDGLIRTMGAITSKAETNTVPPKALSPDNAAPKPDNDSDGAKALKDLSSKGDGWAEAGRKFMESLN